jgi:CRISPR-associated endonuclease/helicase Cas3
MILNAGSRRLEDIPGFALEQLEAANSLLLVCNKKDEAAYLYHALSGLGYQCFHLSASMCMAHRKQTLAALDAALDPQSSNRSSKIICIATQVIEAGVDISFDCVIRLTAGLDNMIQAAGRCNRNGEHPELAPVYALQCADETLGNLQDIQRAKDASISLLAQFAQRPHDFQADLSSDAAVLYYYQRLYQEMPPKFQDYTVEGMPSIYSMLSLNEVYSEDDSSFGLNQAFKSAGALFQVFDDDTEDVLVPYSEGAQCIVDLCSEKAMRDPAYLQSCLERAKPYTVSLFQYQKERLAHQNGLYSICADKVLVVQPQYYDEATGLLTEATQTNYLEVK